VIVNMHGGTTIKILLAYWCVDNISNIHRYKGTNTYIFIAYLLHVSASVGHPPFWILVEGTQNFCSYLKWIQKVPFCGLMRAHLYLTQDLFKNIFHFCMIQAATTHDVSFLRGVSNMSYIIWNPTKEWIWVWKSSMGINWFFHSLRMSYTKI
jgi:hypothetical protein